KPYTTSTTLGSPRGIPLSSLLLGVVSRIALCVNLGEGSLNSLREPLVKGEVEPTQKRAGPAGLTLSFAVSCSSFSPSLLESSRVYVFHDCTPLDVVIFEISSRKRIGWKILP